MADEPQNIEDVMESVVGEITESAWAEMEARDPVKILPDLTLEEMAGHPSEAEAETPPAEVETSSETPAPVSEVLASDANVSAELAELRAQNKLLLDVTKQLVEKPALEPSMDRPDPLKKLEEYAIDPADFTAAVKAVYAQEQAPRIAMERDEAAFLHAYPDAKEKGDAIASFVQAHPEVQQRVSELWQKGEYRAGMEYAYLTHAVQSPPPAPAAAVTPPPAPVAEKVHAGAVTRGTSGGTSSAPKNDKYLDAGFMEQVRLASLNGYDGPLTSIFTADLPDDLPVAGRGR